MRFTIKGNPPTKKNSAQIIMAGSHPRLIPSKAYREYEQIFLWQVPAKAKQKLNLPHTLRCVYYMQTRRRVDLNNLLAATADLLVKAGVLEDDNSRIIYSLDGSRVSYDKENPRVEIEIVPMAEGRNINENV